MWFVTTGTTAIVATVLAIIFKKKYKLGLLSLMLWGATIMIAADLIINYEGGPLFETRTEGLIGNATTLGLAMLIPVILIWIGVLVISAWKKSNKILQGKK